MAGFQKRPCVAGSKAPVERAIPWSYSCAFASDAWVMEAGHTFTEGDDLMYRFTEEGWKRREELLKENS